MSLRRFSRLLIGPCRNRAYSMNMFDLSSTLMIIVGTGR